MASTLAWTLGAVAVISIVSLIGAVALLQPRLRQHRVLMALVAMAAGTLIGDTFLHILPEATAQAHGFTTRIAMYVIGGFVIMFLLEATLRWDHSHVEDTGHEHEHHVHEHTKAQVQPFGWLNLIGDAVHNLLDGAVVAAAFLTDVPLGIATTIAVVAHEVPQELGDFAVLLRSGMAPMKALGLNLMSALLAVVGAVVVLALGLPAETLEGFILPLIAGAFLYIAAADLIPELHHHSKGKDAFLILVFLLAGIAMMAGLLGLEDLIPGA